MAQEKQSIEKYRSSAITYRDLSNKEHYLQARYYPTLLLAVAITLCLTQSFILNYYGYITIPQIIVYLGLISYLRYAIVACA